MRDKDHGGARLFGEPGQEFQNLCLDGDVESSRGLVGEEDLRAAAESHGDHDALAHSAGELMRVTVKGSGGIRDAHAVEERGSARAGFILGQALVKPERLGDLDADLHDRVERGHGLLKDHGDVIATNAAKLESGDLEEVVVGVGLLRIGAKKRAAALDLARRHGNEAKQREGSDALATAGFADDAEGFAGKQIKGQAINGADFAGISEERGAEVRDLEDGGGGEIGQGTLVSCGRERSYITGPTSRGMRVSTGATRAMTVCLDRREMQPVTLNDWGGISFEGPYEIRRIC